MSYHPQPNWSLVPSVHIDAVTAYLDRARALRLRSQSDPERAAELKGKARFWISVARYERRGRRHG